MSRHSQPRTRRRGVNGHPAALAATAALLAVSGCGGTASPGQETKSGERLPGVKEFGLTEVQFPHGHVRESFGDVVAFLHRTTPRRVR